MRHQIAETNCWNKCWAIADVNCWNKHYYDSVKAHNMAECGLVPCKWQGMCWLKRSESVPEVEAIPTLYVKIRVIFMKLLWFLDFERMTEMSLNYIRPLCHDKTRITDRKVERKLDEHEKCSIEPCRWWQQRYKQQSATMPCWYCCHALDRATGSPGWREEKLILQASLRSCLSYLSFWLNRPHIWCHPRTWNLCTGNFSGSLTCVLPMTMTWSLIPRSTRSWFDSFWRQGLVDFRCKYLRRWLWT